MPRTKRLHALKRPKLRQDWSKWNLYNLSRVTTPHSGSKTFFQQKWTAKSMLRSFHNPDVREGTWTRMFDRRLPAVVPMDHRYLAQNDGSEMASGRGMGVDKAPETTGGRVSGSKNAARTGGSARRVEKTPYMHMSFWPLERRLDTAIFRALFASSVRQARQMVVHGFVMVNGKRMIYPGYQLNPGDMFSVDPERVLFSTGAKKHKKDEPGSLQDKARDRELSQVSQGKTGKKKVKPSTGSEVVGSPQEAEAKTAPAADDAAADGESADAAAGVDEKGEARKALRRLASRARRIMDDSAVKPSAKRRQDLRNFTQQVKTSMSKLRGVDEAEVDETVEAFEQAFAEILTKIPTDSLPKTESASIASSQQKDNADASRARKDAELLHAALERARANPVDVTKPYATPWRPRDYMSAFAFVPRYLEVNHNICSAVYIRHPVARPGLAEVPTPFSAETMGLGFNWYLRRR